MTHLVVVLSAIVLTASDATPAEHPFTRHLLPTHLTTASPVTLMAIQYTSPTPTFTTETILNGNAPPASTAIPHSPNISSASLECHASNKEMSQIPKPTDNSELKPHTRTKDSRLIPQNHILTYGNTQKQAIQSLTKTSEHIGLPEAPVQSFSKQIQISESKEQIPSSKNKNYMSQIPVDNKEHQLQRSTEENNQTPQTETPSDIRTKVPQTQTPSLSQGHILHVHTHNSEALQLFERISRSVLHNNSHQTAKHQPPVPYVAPDIPVPSNQPLIDIQVRAPATRHYLQILPSVTRLANCYGDACKNSGRELQQFSQKVQHSGISPILGHMNSQVKSFNDDSNELVHMDSHIPYSNTGMLLKSNVIPAVFANIRTPKSNSKIMKTSSSLANSKKCAKGVNQNCIFKRSIRTETAQETSSAINPAVVIGDIDPGIDTTERESRVYSGITSDSSFGNSTVWRGSSSGSERNSSTLIRRRASNISSTAPTSNSSSSITNSNIGRNNNKRRQKSERRKNHKRGRMRRGRGYRRLERKRKHQGRGQKREQQGRDLSLWIDRRQVKMFSGYMMEIYAIHSGRVLPYILDPNFEKQLPVIPSEVENVNFTWRAGSKRYFYTFDRLYSQDEEVLNVPVLSLPSHGRVPKKPKVFSVKIQCTGNASGIATFGIGLLIQTRQGKPLPGTPLRLTLRKECTQLGPDPECDQKCENGGVCDEGQRCLCPEGYMGQYCNTALCYPQCMNGGTCTTPGRCSCPPGFQGRHCEGGICQDKCQNGGKCIQKDTCDCRRGYYGNRCEFSKCVIPCINGGRCRDVNKCRCPRGFAGDHCEVVMGQDIEATAAAHCSKRCRHGSCRKATCYCDEGYTGRWCRRRGGSISGRQRKRVWV